VQHFRVPDTTGDIARVLEATDIVRLIGEQIALKKKGSELAGLCPFHNDHSPSMLVSPRKQLYKCFSCGAGGDSLKFVTEYHKMTFPEAMQFLADRAGIKLTPFRPRAAQKGDDHDEHAPGVSREELASANRFAAEFFRTILKHPEHGTAARDVIARRGLSPEMVEKFMLGAAPDRWDGLLQVVTKRALATKDFAGAGLLKARDSGGLYDGFRHRLMFPITDTTGRCIAFGARRLRDTDDPKYLNSPESALFDKGGTLYALPQAAQAIKQTQTAIVVEGYMDAIACHQAGVCNVVATLGTALTVKGARLLARLLGGAASQGRIVLLFDGDAAGQRAAERAIEVLFDSPLEIRIATLAGHTDAKDPDELLKRAGGSEVFQRVVEGSIDALEYRFARLAQTLRPLSAQGRARAIEEELEKIAGLGLARMKPLSQQIVIQRLSQLAGVQELVVKQAIARASARASTPRRDEPQPSTSTTAGQRQPLVPRAAIEHALALIVSDPGILEGLDDHELATLAPHRVTDEGFKKIAQALDAARHSGQAFPGALTGAALAASLQYGADALPIDELCAGVQRHYRDDQARMRAGLLDLLAKARREHDLLSAAQAQDPAQRLALLRRAKGPGVAGARGPLDGREAGPGGRPPTELSAQRP
jgi:DNA primase